MLDTAQEWEPPTSNGHASLLDTKPIELDVSNLSTGSARRLEALHAGKGSVSDIIYILQQNVTNWTLEEIDTLTIPELMQILDRVVLAINEVMVPKLNASSSNGHSLPAASPRPRGSKPISSVRRAGARPGK